MPETTVQIDIKIYYRKQRSGMQSVEQPEKILASVPKDATAVSVKNVIFEALREAFGEDFKEQDRLDLSISRPDTR